MTEPPPCPERCPACGMPLELVWVHGHGQCASCGTNVEPCCQGGPQHEPPAADPDEAAAARRRGADRGPS